MSGRSPYLVHKKSAWVASWCVMALCLALDLYGLWALANAQGIGGRLRAKNNAVVVIKVDKGSVLEAAGIRPGTHVLALNGQPVTSGDFVADPDQSSTWGQQDHFWENQNLLNTAAASGSLAITFADNGNFHTVVVPTSTLGWIGTWQRTWALQLVGWSFLLVAFLLWTKKGGETSLLNFVGGVGVCVTLCSMTSFSSRDVALPTTAFVTLAIINYISAQTALISLHLGLVFPAPVNWLSKYPWVRLLPWIAYAIQLGLNFTRVFPGPLWTTYILSPLSLLGFMTIIVVRLVRATDPLLRLQLQWVALGAVGGFLPWVLLTGVPEMVGLAGIPEQYSLLSVIATPVSLSFAVFRYRLLDVDRIFDWVVVHAIALSGFSLAELAFWNWLSRRYTPQAGEKPALLALSLCIFVFLYAPLRTWLFRLLTAISGRTRPSLNESLRKLLERARATETPSAALEQTLQWTLNPSDLSWVHVGHGMDSFLDRLEKTPDGLLGYEFGDDCPQGMESAAWVPIQVEQGLAAITLWPQGSRSWSRSDLRIARTLARAGEPLFEMQRMQRSHQRTEKALREQREELVREMHDGLGSQLFGASLLTNVSPNMTAPELEARFGEVSAALCDAMDSLRTGLTVLGAPPGAFGPAVLALLLRAEQVLDAAGIALQPQIDDEAASVQLDSRAGFSLLRAMQEALTNIARHSQASMALVRITLQNGMLAVLIQDDGVGFILSETRAGHGITNIQRRLQMLAGTAVIDSAPKAGCTVSLSLPLQNGAL